jgi:hypothetical protein
MGIRVCANFKVSYDITKKILGGLEYYGSLGPVGNFDPSSQQQQQFFRRWT